MLHNKIINFLFFLFDVFSPFYKMFRRKKKLVSVAVESLKVLKFHWVFCCHLPEFNIASKFGWERYLVMLCCLVASTILDSVVIKRLRAICFSVIFVLLFLFLKDEWHKLLEQCPTLNSIMWTCSKVVFPRFNLNPSLYQTCMQVR